MTDRTRQTGAGRLVTEGVGLAGRLAIGLLAAPLLGLALASWRTKPSPPSAAQAVEPTPDPPSQSSTRDPAARGDGEPGPARAEIEKALLRLTDATIPKRARAPQPSDAAVSDPERGRVPSKASGKRPKRSLQAIASEPGHAGHR